MFPAACPYGPVAPSDQSINIALQSSQGDGELEYSKCPIFETKDTIDLKTYQEINLLGGLSHGGNKNLAGFANFDFRIL